MAILDIFTESNVVDQENIHYYPIPTQYDTIVRGGTIEHTFELPLDIDARLETFEIFYKNGITEVIHKTKYDESVSYSVISDHWSIVSCILSPEETIKFEFNRPTYAQLKFLTKNGFILYSAVHPVKVISAIDNQNKC